MRKIYKCSLYIPTGYQRDYSCCDVCFESSNVDDVLQERKQKIRQRSAQSVNPGRGEGVQLLNSKQHLGSSPLLMALGHLKSLRARISEACKETWQLFY